MATTNFYIQNQRNSSYSYIFFYITDKGKRYRVPTSEKIDSKYWNVKKQRVKNNYTGCVELNAFLDNFEERVLKIYQDAKAKDIIVTNEYLKTKLEEKEESSKKVAIIVNKEEAVKREKRKTFWEILDQFIESMAVTRTVGTLKTYRTLRKHLQNFKKKTLYNVSFDNINNIFRDRFHSFLITELRLGDTVIHKYFQILKTFLNYATEYGFNTSLEFKKFKFKRADVQKVALTEEEILAIKGLDLSNTPRLERIKDMFLFMCATSLRYSDMQALKPSGIQNASFEGQDVRYLDLVAQKTRGEIQSPLSTYALKIIEKYKQCDPTFCFPRITNQKFNEYLKEVAKLAEINEKITIIRFIGMERIETEHFKHELVCCHTARRTFVTQFFEKGGSSTACMVFTGHKDPSELETYRKKTLQHRLKLTKDLSLVPLA